jgi:hypothetical protein
VFLGRKKAVNRARGGKSAVSVEPRTVVVNGRKAVFVSMIRDRDSLISLRLMS